MKSALLIFIALLVAACSPVHGFLESEFDLSGDSPLPPWYASLPSGYERRDIKIHISLYTPILPVGNTVFTVSDKKGKILYKSSGQNQWHPKYWTWAQKDWPARAHPAYSIMEIAGQRAVVEFKRMEPIFYISNEAAVQALLGKDY